MNLFQKIDELLKSKPKLPPCGKDNISMWCYCGKCKQEGYKLPEDFNQIIALTAIQHYKDNSK